MRRIICFLLLLFALPLMAQDVTVDRRQVSVGDTLRLALPDGAELLEYPGVTVMGQGPGYVEILVDRLDSLPLAFSYQLNGEVVNYAAEPIPVVSNLEADPEKIELKPIRDIIPGRPAWLNYLIGALVVLVILALVALIVYLWKRRERAAVAAPVEPPVERAVRELEQLEASQIFEHSQKGYYFAFSEIMRRYMGAMRGITALDMTTEEIRRHATNEDRELIRLLLKADMVKFADAGSTDAVRVLEMEEARNYIERTKPLEEEL